MLESIYDKENMVIVSLYMGNLSIITLAFIYLTENLIFLYM